MKKNVEEYKSWDEIDKEFEQFEKDHPWRTKLNIAYYRTIKWIKDIPWHFKWRFVKKHRYNKINLPMLPGYYDSDVRLLAAIFTEASKFVKDAELDWEYNEQHREMHKALTRAKSWWDEHKDRIMYDEHEFVSFKEEEEFSRKTVEVAKGVIEHVHGMWWP